MSSFLEKWAYIMIIIVCFTILFTILIYFLSLLIKKRNKSNCCSKHLTEKNDSCTNPKCVNCEIAANKHSAKSGEPNTKENTVTANYQTLSIESLSDKSSASDEDKYKLKKQESILVKHHPNKLDSETSSIGESSNIQLDNNLNDGFFNQLLKRLKSTFFSDINVTEIREENRRNFEKSNYDNSAFNRKESVITENESDLISSKKSSNNNKQIRSSIRKANKKSRYLRKSSLHSSSHSVKFKTNLKDRNDSDEDEQCSSDEYSSTNKPETSKIPISQKKNSVDSSKKSSFSSYTNSRKSSSNSSYHEPAVVDYYRKKRFSDASSILTNNTSIYDLKYPDNRKLSISYTSPFKESNVKLIALEQQPNILSSNLTSKKSSTTSVATSSSRLSSSINSGRSRRCSIMTSNLSEKFWVPPEIAKSAQLEKQRSSLPNSDVILESNEKALDLNTNSNCEEINESSDKDFTELNMDSNSNSRRESGTSGGALGSFASTKNIPTAGLPGAGRRRASMFDPIDPTELQKTLYQNQKHTIQESRAVSDDAIVESIGAFEFGVQYLSDSQKLIIDILRVFDLQFKETTTNSTNITNNSDIYCKCVLMPDKFSFQTKLVKRTSNPIFEEQFDFDYLDSSKLESRYLELYVYEIDKLTREDCLGIAVLKLNYPNIETKKIFLKDIKPFSRPREENYIGDLMFSLAYLPAAERLTIVIIKARNLNGLGHDKKMLPDPFVKVSILTKDGKKLKKKKTSSQKGTMCPVYNEEIVFTHLKKEQLSDIIIQLTVYHDSITNRECLGFVSISSLSKGNEYVQWKDMLDGKKSNAWWHPLSLSSSNIDSDANPCQNLNLSNRKNSSRTINLSKLKPLSILSNSSSVNKQAISENS